MKFSTQAWIVSFLLLVGVLLTGCSSADPIKAEDLPQATPQPAPTDSPTPKVVDVFDGARAYEHVAAQVDFGPRVPESAAHSQVGMLINEHLAGLGWVIEEQAFEVEGVKGRNIIGKANQNKGPVLILGAHYDSRIISERSPESDQPTPGANDGASGVAVLMELARALNLENIENEIWLVFFDLEDQGGGAIPNLDFIEGSRYMANNLAVTPAAVIIVDMVGDIDQQFPYEGYSDTALKESIWKTAEELGYGQYFPPILGKTIRDDHLPFLENEIPAVTILDFDYTYWHTIEDTADKVDPDSLDRVGKVLQHWLEMRAGS